MALTKVVVIDKIEILENEVIQIRVSRRIFDDGELAGERYFRYVIEPGQDVTNEPLRVRRAANAMWTPQVIADYQAWKAAQPKP